MTSEVRREQGVATWGKVVAGILFTVPWILYLLLPAYNTTHPELGCVPFFYWFQTLWFVISSILYTMAVLLLYPGRR